MDGTVQLNGAKRWVQLFVQKEHFNKFLNVFQSCCHHFVFSKCQLGEDGRSGRYQTISFSEKNSITSNKDLNSSAWNLSVELRTSITFSKVVAMGTTIG